MDMRLELVRIPVTDVDRAKAFYVDAGFVCDHDETVHEGLRFVQLTPPGSACSIAFGVGISDSEPGSVKGLLMVIDDAVKAHEVLSARGIDVSDVDHQEWGEFLYFADPDGNTWALQELPAR
ncbi:VOC family protein [Actinospongicola halichondriae]|uniref:VOC family protein n=1 Tax=Actinospongicola halichondriae TaxID=3236844 RepID=UPI003D3AB294